MQHVSRAILVVGLLLSSRVFAQSVPLDDIDNVLERKNACVTADTMVTLSDGRSVKVSDIRSGDSIRNGDNHSVRVLDLVAGPEKKPVFRITLDDGSKVIATEFHPFLSAEGTFITATELTRGTKLRTVKGVGAVTRIEKGGTPVSVYNLLLIDENLYASADRSVTLKTREKVLNWKAVLRKQKPFLGLSEDEHTFYTNGILSGDLVVQMSLQQ